MANIADDAASRFSEVVDKMGRVAEMTKAAGLGALAPVAFTGQDGPSGMAAAPAAAVDKGSRER
jgi:hypothetical protein